MHARATAKVRISVLDIWIRHVDARCFVDDAGLLQVGRLPQVPKKMNCGRPPCRVSKYTSCPCTDAVFVILRRRACRCEEVHTNFSGRRNPSFVQQGSKPSCDVCATFNIANETFRVDGFEHRSNDMCSSYNYLKQDGLGPTRMMVCG